MLRVGCHRGVRVLLVLGIALAAAAPGTADDADYDAALAALAARIESKPANRDLARRLSAPLEAARRDPQAASAALRERIGRLGLVPLRVPGLFYETHRWTGADLAAVETWLDRPVAMLRTGEVATVEQNARIVAAELRGLTGKTRRALVVSASKGSAEVRAALEADASLGARVAIWIDLVGVLEGTALTDAGVAPDWLPRETAPSLSRAVRLPAAAPERFPPLTRAVHVAAFPRAGDVSAAARAPFARQRPLGPNDGYVLLDSYLRAPGRVVIVHGVDHYLRHGQLREVLLAVLAVLLDELEAENGQRG